MALKEYYKVAIDWTGLVFCGVKLTWDYKQCRVHCSMPEFINNALNKYQHPTPMAPKNTIPYAAAPFRYSAKVQRVNTNTIFPLSPAEMRQVQDIIGSLLCYTQAVKPTLLATLSAIAVQQSNSTQAVANACHQLLDYVATHPNAGLQYHA
jgi:hypothetical protein